MNPLEIIAKYYDKDSLAYHLVVEHGQAVAKKALAVADRMSELNPDKKFIEEAALLHDVGILFTDAPVIGCFGKEPYIRHGILGRELLEKEGFSRHALVCERHVGVGLTVEEIQRQNLPLPARDMRPVSLEEKIIAFADKFFSKKSGDILREKSKKEVLEELSGFGQYSVDTFNSWCELFKE